MSNENELVEYGDGVSRPAHSTKGASSAERWMNCPGSSAIIAAFELPVTDEPSYRREGTAMHEAAADCLARDIDTWEIVGETYYNTVMTADMCDAVQVYLDRVRPSIDRERGFHGEQFFIEAKLAAPDVHKQMFGSVDFGALVQPGQEAWKTCGDGAMGGFLDVTDLKGGEGIVVDPEENAQMKYYAFMLIATKFPDLDDDFLVRLTIVQPRAFHHEGPVRDWWTTVGDIKSWVVRELLPAMHSTDDALEAGKWCRFCPAKLVCPLMNSLFRAASVYDPKAIPTLNSESLGHSYQQVEAVKFYLKALEDEVFRRLNAGTAVPGTKLVNKKANRIFNTTMTAMVEGKEVEIATIALAREKFGDAAFTQPELKSPAELEKLGPEAKAFVKSGAYMPVTGLTVAVESDKRTEVKVQSATERFGAALENLTE